MALVLVIFYDRLVLDELDLFLLVLLLRIFDPFSLNETKLEARTMNHARRANQDINTTLCERNKTCSQFRLVIAMKNGIAILRRVTVQCLT